MSIHMKSSSVVPDLSVVRRQEGYKKAKLPAMAETGMAR
ncbi:hypothetical protein SF123566_9776 [Shigella flexneri 1235-66]|nr:hypothetical protein SF123566_9776 [Shigella flexneri 1235-66]